MRVWTLTANMVEFGVPSISLGDSRTSDSH